MEVQIFQAREKLLGAEHPNTLMSMFRLAAIYSSLNRLNEAEKMGVQGLKTRKMILGAEHPHTLLTMANLAVTDKALDRLSEAEELGVQVLKAYEKVLGAEHPKTLRGIASLALTSAKMNRLDETETLEVQALKGRKNDSRRRASGHADQHEQSGNHMEQSESAQKNHLVDVRCCETFSNTYLGPDDPDSKDRQEWLNLWLEWLDQRTENETEERRRMTDG